MTLSYLMKGKKPDQLQPFLPSPPPPMPNCLESRSLLAFLLKLHFKTKVPGYLFSRCSFTLDLPCMPQTFLHHMKWEFLLPQGGGSILPWLQKTHFPPPHTCTVTEGFYFLPEVRCKDLAQESHYP